MRFYKTTIGKSFVLFSICSIIIMAILFRSVSYDTVKIVKNKDTKEYLKALAMELEYSYELMDTSDMGFYILDDELYSGDIAISKDNSVIDRMKKYSNAEFSVFCRNKRVLTTILDENGERFVGTTSDVWYKRGQYSKIYYSDDVEINGKKYYGYYYPLRNISGESIGMAFAGIPTEDIQGPIKTMNARMIQMCILFGCLSIIATALITSIFLKKQNQLMKYLSEINKSEFDHSLPPSMVNGKDEYGVMSRYMVSLNESLEKMIQRDGLTGLLNRRAIMRTMERYVAMANSIDGKTFSYAIGDIDFFKKVNDTYGHYCGDAVLVKVSEIMEEMMKDYGFAGRWGGEEFVLVFKGKITDAHKRLEEIAEAIRNEVITYEDYEVKVTMTFGMAEYAPPNKLDYVLSKADRLLYEGKEAGRNRIVI